MANAKQCDICGNFYAAHKNSKKLRSWDMYDSAVISIYDPEPNKECPDDDDRITMETCPKCMARIREFIASMKEE